MEISSNQEDEEIIEDIVNMIILEMLNGKHEFVQTSQCGRFVKRDME